MRRFRAWPVLIFLAAPAFAGGGGAPTSSALSPSCPAPQGDLPCLSLDARLIGRDVKVEVFPAQLVRDGPGFYPPAFVRTTFSGQGQNKLELCGSEFPRERLDIYPIEGLLRQYPRTYQYGVRDQLQTLRRLLRDRPDLRSLRAKLGMLPFLPLNHCGQLVRAAERYISFSGGAGIRSLVIFRQDYSPFLRREPLYSFQGLTNDGRYWISFTFPVAPKFLPASEAEFRGEDLRVFRSQVSRPEDEDRGVARATQGLDALTDDPSVTRLDAVVRSLRLR